MTKKPEPKTFYFESDIDKYLDDDEFCELKNYIRNKFLGDQQLVAINLNDDLDSELFDKLSKLILRKTSGESIFYMIQWT